ncbi:MAG TPA: response regulator transcription factor [Acidobacteriaceae bacterium]|jgi:DNA-binding response OmpR family regulator
MSTAAHVLIVEDEEHLAQGLKFNLEAEGYRASIARDGETALEIAAAPDAAIDVILLDVMLPGCDGFAVVEQLRERDDRTPVLMLTARGRSEDVLRGFAAGADDYLPKPFDLSILLARLHGLLRRWAWQRREHDAAATAEVEAPYSFAGRTIDFAALELRVPDHDKDGRSIRLTVMETELLRYLVRHQGRSISRKELLEQVWRMREDTDTRAIDNFIVRLRRYIEDDPANPVFLKTVRGIGYRFEPQPSHSSGHLHL